MLEHELENRSSEDGPPQFHVNPKTGDAGRCFADIKCDFGPDAVHGDTIEEARRKDEELNKSRVIQSLSKSDDGHGEHKPATLKNVIEASKKPITTEFVENFANQSKENFNQLDSIISERRSDALKRSRRLTILTNDPVAKYDLKTLRNLQKELELHRDETARLSDAKFLSKFFKPHYEELGYVKRVGQAELTRGYTPYNSTSEADIAALAVYDFTDPRKSDYSDVMDLYRVEKGKQQLVDFERGRSEYRRLALRNEIRDKFAEISQQMGVYSVEGIYNNPIRDWQATSFDGLLSSRNDGNFDGIFRAEVMNNEKEWRFGLPKRVRAEALYQLNTSGLNFIDIGVLFNESDIMTFRLKKDDHVSPNSHGGDISMEDYMQTRVSPWFSDLISSRD